MRAAYVGGVEAGGAVGAVHLNAMGVGLPMTSGKNNVNEKMRHRHVLSCFVVIYRILSWFENSKICKVILLALFCDPLYGARIARNKTSCGGFAETLK
jgi:hypothetical protein